MEKSLLQKVGDMGTGNALVKPDTLLQIWKILKICTRDNKIIIMQGANTGLTGGSNS